MDIPFKAHATPDTLAYGDLVALYAGYDTPSHVATFSHLIRPAGFTGDVIMVTTDGERFDVQPDSQIWVAAYAPWAESTPPPPRTTEPSSWRRASRFAPMGVK